jgi:1-acyl-sn-glycerol-3-phosphate acyltransferase
MSKVDSFLAGHSLASRAFYVFGRTVAVGLMLLLTRLRVEGREHVPRTGAFVLAPVHRSYLDTPIVAAVTRRRLRYMGKDSLWRARWKGWLCSALGAFPVTRGSADREALKRCIAVLEAGEPLVLFPEGERKSGPTVQPLFQGAAYVAVKAGVPIVPVGIGGSERVMPKGVKLPRPHKVVVRVGPPLYPPVTADRRSRDVVRDLTDQLHRVLQELFDGAQEAVGHPNPPASDG